MLRFLRLLLLPLSWLYAGIMALRNWLYNHGIKQSFRFEIPIISVGNLTVGGTGKTPHVEYLIRLLKKNYQVTSLSRGYGRKTKGFRLASERETAETIGDEPYQLYRKFAPAITVAVGERRAEAIRKLVTLQPRTQAIMLDDAYQHRSVVPTLSILLTDYSRPFYQDAVLPAGRLRETRQGARRADIVIVTKCPLALAATSMHEIKQKIYRYARPQVSIFFTGIRYGEPVAFGNPSLPFHRDLILVSGLANPRPLEDYVNEHFHLLKHIEFRDHHRYSYADIVSIQRVMKETGGRSILVTEKDYVKLIHPTFEQLTNSLPFFYLPIEIVFLEGQQGFNAIIAGLGLSESVTA